MRFFPFSCIMIQGPWKGGNPLSKVNTVASSCFPWKLTLAFAPLSCHVIGDHGCAGMMKREGSRKCSFSSSLKLLISWPTISEQEESNVKNGNCVVVASDYFHTYWKKYWKVLIGFNVFLRIFAGLYWQWCDDGYRTAIKQPIAKLK